MVRAGATPKNRKPRLGTQAALAEERGITQAAVSINVKNGTLDPAFVMEGTKRLLDLDKANEILDALPSTKKRPDTPLPAGLPDDDDDETTEDEIPTQVVSRAKREFYNAKLARLEFEEKAGRLVDAEKVRKEAFELARTVRDQILAIPDRVAAILAAEKSERRVHDLLTKELTQALSELVKRETK